VLFYRLQFGPIEKREVRQSLQTRHVLPDAIRNAPELNKGLQIFLQAFFDLDTERPVSLEIGRIPYFKVKKYGKSLGYKKQDLRYFIDVINRLDLAYVKKQNGKSSDAGADAKGESQ